MARLDDAAALAGVARAGARRRAAGRRLGRRGAAARRRASTALGAVPSRRRARRRSTLRRWAVARRARRSIVHDAKPLLEACAGGRRAAAERRGHRAGRVSAEPGPARRTSSTRCAWRPSASARPRRPRPAPEGRVVDDALGAVLGERAPLARALLDAARRPSSTSARCARSTTTSSVRSSPCWPRWSGTASGWSRPRLEAFAKELERSLDNLTREIHAAGRRGRSTIASPKQLAADPVREAEAAGDPAHQDRLLDRRRRADRAGARAPAARARSSSTARSSKLKGTYADALPVLVNPRTGRIHTTFNQLVAATGRLVARIPNLMNIPIRTELGRRIRPGVHPGGGLAVRGRRLLADRAAHPRAPLGGAGHHRVVPARRGHPHAHRLRGVQGRRRRRSRRCSARSPRARTTPSSTASRRSGSRRPPRSTRRRPSATSTPTSPPTRACGPSSIATLAEGRERGYVTHAARAGAATCPTCARATRWPATPPSAWP